jgi:RHS repeat-associated protein
MASSQRHESIVNAVTFMHAGFNMGPALFTNDVGNLIEERRYEPFGEPIDASGVGARDLNALNKRTDTATGWSDHGARWLVNETARWLTPDPPVRGPGPSSMQNPWRLHPYQYVDQNPVAYWDPDGNQAKVVRLTVEAVDTATDVAMTGGEGDAIIVNAVTVLATLERPYLVGLGYQIVALFALEVGKETIQAARRSRNEYWMMVRYHERGIQRHLRRVLAEHALETDASVIEFTAAQEENLARLAREMRDVHFDDKGVPFSWRPNGISVDPLPSALTARELKAIGDFDAAVRAGRVINGARDQHDEVEVRGLGYGLNTGLADPRELEGTSGSMRVPLPDCLCSRGDR